MMIKVFPGFLTKGGTNIKPNHIGFTTEMVKSVLSQHWISRDSIRQQLFNKYPQQLSTSVVDDLALHAPLNELLSKRIIRRSLERFDGRSVNVYKLRTEDDSDTDHGYFDN